jgi:hypothetical protein
MKTYNLKAVEVGDLKLIRDDYQSLKPMKDLSGPSNTELDNQEQAELQDELKEYEEENLLISDPEEYERRVANV